MARRERSRRAFLTATAAATGLTAAAGCLEPNNTENNTTNQTTNQTQQREHEEDLQDGLTEEEIQELDEVLQDWFRIPRYTAEIEDETGINTEEEQVEVVFTSDYEMNFDLHGKENFRNELNALTFRYESLIENNEEINNLGYDLHLIGTAKNGETHKTCVDYEVADKFAGTERSDMDYSEWIKKTGLDEYQESC